MKQIVIYGTSSFAKRIYQYIQNEKSHQVLAFCVHRDFIIETEINELPVYAFEDLSSKLNMNLVEILIAVGYSRMNKIREEVFCECKLLGYNVASFMSKYALIQTEDIGEGNIILHNAYIGVNCQIGNCNVISFGNSLGHDNIIGNFNFISTSVIFGGGSVIKNNCFVGLNSTLKSGILIDDYSLVGSATNVLHSTDKYGVYVGNPAKKIKENSLESKI